ncbi:alpha/beta hydrolase [Sporolactobacillus sp. CPB3-1]|uniref:Alpha/beta hydrolase n=1 Tax=Sporolactobacillus mangiferae TaxID=2940498 RepID=A0ABT0MAX8_9BACL|nr:alpha/beta hydrolase [Sporolactobacillus mangiferae]MCL1631823.1 alpha/beta hydrolase [Sporolactobacillus mangiferae]
MKFRVPLFIFLALTLIAFGFSAVIRSENAEPTHIKTESSNTSAVRMVKRQIPTVFIHGWKGTERSFKTMLRRFKKNYNGPERAIIMTVEPNGAVKSSGQITDQKIPLIQVIFSSNHESMQQQAVWLKNVFFILKNTYHLNEVNVVSHSMGGKAFTYYLEKIENQTHYPVVKKYVAIAAPFDWISGPQNDRLYTLEQLKRESYLVQHHDRLPQDLDVLAIAGVMRNVHEGDGVVSLQGAFFGRYFFNRDHYKEKIVYGAKAQHSMLHENPQVDRIIADFLWKIHPKN